VSPRPRKPRRCSCPFRGDADLVFKPAGTPLRELERLDLGRDELEALILCDRDGLTQEEAGARMGVSRGTVQRLVSGARGKVADALAGEKALVVRPEVRARED
jgi:uncharacterized protein